MQLSIFYITTGDQETAERLGKLAVENRLAACANISSINSIFPWENVIQHEEEFVLILKTLPIIKSDLQSLIAENHPYDVPCIMSWEVAVNEEYGNWIMENVVTPLKK